MKHWSGAPSHEEFVRFAASVPHPLDNTPEFVKIQELTKQILANQFRNEFGPPTMPDMLPAHYRK